MTTIQELAQTALDEIKDYGLSGLSDILPDTVDGAELHNALFNTEYFIIGTEDAKQWLDTVGTFEAIDLVREYENDNFGQSLTEIDPEKIANMVAYIVGEEWLNNSPTLQDAWDRLLTAEDLAAIKIELTEVEV